MLLNSFPAIHHHVSKPVSSVEQVLNNYFFTAAHSSLNTNIARIFTHVQHVYHVSCLQICLKVFHVFAAVFRSLFLLLWLWLALYIRDTHTLLRATERLSGRCEDLYLIIKVMFTLCVLVSIICAFQQTIIIHFYNSSGLCVLIR